MSSPVKFPGEFHRRYLFQPPTADLSSRPPEGKVDSDVVIILAALLCTLISIVGLGFMARCAWSCHWRRRGAATSAISPPDLAASANKGLKKKTLRALPKTVYGGEGALVGNSSDCAICLTEFIAGEELRVLPQCGHCFHVKCVDTWLSSHSSCPSCRKILVEKGGLSGGKCERCGLQGVVLLTSSSGHVAENHGERTLPEREELSSRGEDDVLRFLPQ